jgi:catechol 2,3-dioxygenase-like lactoylglutathione lyase family enzyme
LRYLCTLAMQANALDHVALWVADRDPLTDFACEHLGMHVIERTDDFTLVGADARRGKLTLFEAEGPREPGVLERVVLRVSDLEHALEALPARLDVERAGEVASFQAPEGLGLGLVEAADVEVEYDIDHVVLRVPEPERTRDGLAELGLSPDGAASLTVGDKAVALVQADVSESERPLLNHIALLVDSGQDQLEEAKRRGIEIAEVRDAANTFAVFVWGPDRIKLEYVEHKPTFSLVSGTQTWPTCWSRVPAWQDSSRRPRRAPAARRLSCTRRAIAAAGRCCCRAA